MLQTSDLINNRPQTDLVFDFDQAWLQAHQARFAPASVRLCRTDNGVLVWAELWDAHIGTRATRDGQMLSELGDCFEIFLSQTPVSPYVEIHLAPNGLTLEMQWSETGNAGEFNFERDVITRGLLKCHATEIETANAGEIGRWFARAEIGWEAFLRGDALNAAHGGEPVSFWANFGRYDYDGCDSNKPVLSATARHSLSAQGWPNFHNRADWHQVSL